MGLLASAFLLWTGMAAAQTASAESWRHTGPMLGHTSMRTIQTWIQTDAPREVWISYVPQAGGTAKETEKVTTATATSLAAHHTLTDLEPGTTYELTYWIDGVALETTIKATTQVLWDSEWTLHRSRW